MEKEVKVIDYGFFTRDGLDFEYHVSGNAQGEALVMLSGNGGDYRCFEGDLYKPLSEYFKIIRFSTRGTGKTPLGDKKLTFDLFCDDLKGLLDYLNVEKANICGFSDGGNLGMCFTVKYPQYVSKLAVFGSNLNTRGTKTGDQLGIIKDHRIYAIKAAITKDPEWIRRREIEGMMVGQPKLNYKKLSAINVPFLNVFGEFDMIKRRHSRRITKAVKGAEEVMVLNGGHSTAFRKTDFLILPVVKKFLGV
ncbi:MAG: alpha/beta fold hydrolase [Clostridia bacterium]|nr:alpha/beta fold hydrolase [Clostridia bacterium]